MTTYQQALGDWLDDMGDWTHWCTITSRPRQSWDGVRSVASWRRTMDHWLASIDCDRAFWATEPGSRLGRSHVHALIYWNPDPPPEERGFLWAPPTHTALWRDLHTRYGRAHVEPYERGKGAAHYCGKYVTKTLSDYDIYKRD